MSSTTEQKRNNYFHKSASYVSGLMHFIPDGEKKFVKKWIQKLLKMNETENDQILRNDYIWLLLTQLQIGKLTKPFLGNPVKNLAPISKSDKENHKKILHEADKQARFIEGTTTNKLNKTEIKLENPSDFPENQPIPKKGFVVYGSCFSHH